MLIIHLCIIKIYIYHETINKLPSKTLLKFPWCGYNKTSKEINSVFIDHCWPGMIQCQSGKNVDWSERISDWLVNSKFKVYKHIRFDEDRDMLKQSETPIPVKSYSEYMSIIKPIETYIITHSESFSYSLIDFASTGARILIPHECFLWRSVFDSYNIKTFKDKDSLLNELDTYNPGELDISNFHTYDQIVEIMEGYFKSWI